MSHLNKPLNTKLQTKRQRSNNPNMPLNTSSDGLNPSSDGELAIVGRLALNLHRSGSKDLHASMPNTSEETARAVNSDYVIDAGTVQFPTIAARNRIVSAYVFRNEKTQGSKPDWLGLAYDLLRHEIGESDSAAGRLLALVNNDSDVLLMAATAIRDCSAEVFETVAVIESYLPHLEQLSAEGLWNLCEALYAPSGNHAVLSFGRLRDRLIHHPDVCLLIHRRFENGIGDATADLHPLVITALAYSSASDAVSLCLSDTASENAILSSVALWTLGQLLFSSQVEDDLVPKACAAIIDNLSSPLDRRRKAAMRAAAMASVSTDAFVRSLSVLGEMGDEYALAAICEALWRNLNVMKDKSFFQSWLRLLCKVSPSQTTTIDLFDVILSRLLTDPAHKLFAINCFTDWIQINGEDRARNLSLPKLFESVIWQLAESKEFLSQVITDWFLSENRRLPAAVGGLLSHLGVHGFTNPEFHASTVEKLSQSDLVFLARRLVGFMFSEEHLLSLAMSLCRTALKPEDAFPVLRSLFVNEVGYDYPGSTIRKLEAAESNSTDPLWKSFYSSSLQAVKDRMNALNVLPDLVELQPPSELQHRFARARAKQMNESMEEAGKHSIIRRLATQVSLKAGVGYFSFHEGAYSEPSQLKTISHGVNLPRRVTLDTVGQELRSFWLCRAKRGES